MSLEVAFIATGAAVLIGVTIGVTSGYFRGWVDSLLGRLMDVVLAFPILLLAIGFASACSLGHGCLGGLITPGQVDADRRDRAVLVAVHRPHRARANAVDPGEGVRRCRPLAGGVQLAHHGARRSCPTWSRRSSSTPSLILPTNVLYEAALSFLGVGVQPPTASWGQMISVAGQTYPEAWWYMVFPGVALVLTVLAFNLVGDGLQDALNPKTGR